MKSSNTQETGSAYVTGKQSSRSVAPQDVGIAQEKLGDVSGFEQSPAVKKELKA